MGKGKEEKKKKGKGKRRGEGEEREREGLPVAQQICTSAYPGSAWSALAQPGDRCRGAARVLEEDKHKVTCLPAQGHGHTPTRRLLGPACPYPPKQLAWAQRGWKPSCASRSHTSRWGEPTSLALGGSRGGRLSWAQVVSPSSVPRPGRRGPG